MEYIKNSNFEFLLTQNIKVEEYYLENGSDEYNIPINDEIDVIRVCVCGEFSPVSEYECTILKKLKRQSYGAYCKTYETYDIYNKISSNDHNRLYKYKINNILSMICYGYSIRNVVVKPKKTFVLKYKLPPKIYIIKEYNYKDSIFIKTIISNRFNYCKIILDIKYYYDRIREYNKELNEEFVKEWIKFMSKPAFLMKYLENGGTIEEWNTQFE
jgi:hypothetical protein